MDTIDDLEHAEDMIGAGLTALHLLLGATFNAPTETVARLRSTLAAMDAYCRQSCGMEGVPHDDVVIGGVTVTRGEARCGCPCHDRGNR